MRVTYINILFKDIPGGYAYPILSQQLQAAVATAKAVAGPKAVEGPKVVAMLPGLFCLDDLEDHPS